MKEFRIKILAADKTLYEGPCVSVTVPLSDGYMGILAGHSNMVSAVVTGIMSYRTGEEAEPVRAAVSNGLLKVENGEVLVLVDSAEMAKDIDIVRAQKAADAARDKLLREQSKLEQMAAEADLARAINRTKSTKNDVGKY